VAAQFVVRLLYFKKTAGKSKERILIVLD